MGGGGGVGRGQPTPISSIWLCGRQISFEFEEFLFNVRGRGGGGGGSIPHVHPYGCAVGRNHLILEGVLFKHIFNVLSIYACIFMNKFKYTKTKVLPKIMSSVHFVPKYISGTIPVYVCMNFYEKIPQFSPESKVLPKANFAILSYGTRSYL